MDGGINTHADTLINIEPAGPHRAADAADSKRFWCDSAEKYYSVWMKFKSLPLTFYKADKRDLLGQNCTVQQYTR